MNATTFTTPSQEEAAGVVRRYVQQWNEPNPLLRHDAIRQMWTRDAAHFTPTREFRGHEALFRRITEAHEQFVSGGIAVFAPGDWFYRSQRAVALSWSMLSSAGEKIGGGYDLLLLDDASHIRKDWQFSTPTVAVAELNQRAEAQLASNGSVPGRRLSGHAAAHHGALWADWVDPSSHTAGVDVVIDEAMKSILYRFEKTTEGLPW
ncbi:hypothetical protein [Gryllotalpicola protaetiae]|uniref:SnoaL-like domain-containing protein n=1 Tax=Gryllotalpicola protaetiae TaxID=2419771 RepID=A0A387BUA2_9MICO|nr:hypothetical protein [Gryllotalpicola protaetiae]AYG04589.1 hypothetical protein D7I44_14355 [Gryllotalpicola protaetiae]